jgi:hypothetical protein
VSPNGEMKNEYSILVNKSQGKKCNEKGRRGNEIAKRRCEGRRKM